MSANPRQDGCQSGACKRSADQANDVLSYMATLGSGFRGASAAELGGDVWVPPEWSRGGSVGAGSEEPKAKGCQKQGPGCASRACNECADMAVEVLDYMSTLGDGIVRATPESVLASRMSGGFVPGGHAFGGSRYREAAEDCDAKDPASACDPELSEFYVSHGPWFSRGGSCYREVTCANYAANCDVLDPTSSKSAAHAMCESHSTSTVNCWVKAYEDGGFLYWKFTPNGSGGGTCDGVWQCADINTGASCGTGSGGGLGTGTAVATNVTRTQECAGCLTGTAVDVPEDKYPQPEAAQDSPTVSGPNHACDPVTSTYDLLMHGCTKMTTVEGPNSTMDVWSCKIYGGAVSSVPLLRNVPPCVEINEEVCPTHPREEGRSNFLPGECYWKVEVQSAPKCAVRYWLVCDGHQPLLVRSGMPWDNL